MAFDAGLAERLRDVLADFGGVAERKMFGGLAFLVNGNMCCGIVGDRLMIRLDRDSGRDALQEPHTAPMDFTGKPLSGFLFVEPRGFECDDDLRRWLARAYAFASGLPPK